MALDDNPLKSLIVEDNQNLDLHQLTDLLTNRVGFTAEAEVQFLSDFHNMNNQQKLLLVLLGAKARSILFDSPDGFTPSEIIEFDIMPLGSVKSTLKALLEDTHEIKKNADKRYYVPNYVTSKLASRFNKEAK